MLPSLSIRSRYWQRSRVKFGLDLGQSLNCTCQMKMVQHQAKAEAGNNSEHKAQYGQAKRSQVSLAQQQNFFMVLIIYMTRP